MREMEREMEIANLHGVRLGYVRRGQGEPLVLLHGFPLDHSIWDPLAGLIDSEFDLVIPDLRGFGESSTVESVYGVDEMAGDVAALLDHLGIEKAFLAGHSMGGYVALAFLRGLAERLRGLALVPSQLPADPPERREGR
jgi:pimeloyl-ACP methyl ester carboxylesterase